MFPDRPRISIPIIVRKDGERFIAKFPVEMEAGDQIIILREMRGWEAPGKGTLSGYTDNGPVFTPEGGASP